jgi:surfactin synthase thioesterase subunit
MANISTDSNRWFFVSERKQQVALRVFCFPFGGGGASFYRAWAKGLPPEVELCAVQLPGREERLREQPFNRLIPLVKTLSVIIDAHRNIPFAFFGHSMGALIGFELTRQLRRENRTCPIHVFVSGRSAPQIKNTEPIGHDLPEYEFIDKVRSYDGTPELVFQDPELLELFLPILRADFAIVDTYQYKEEHPINCPITVFGGLGDSSVSHEELKAWRQQTSGKFRVRMFPGGHFYLKDAREVLLREIREDLKTYLNLKEH